MKNTLTVLLIFMAKWCVANTIQTTVGDTAHVFFNYNTYRYEFKDNILKQDGNWELYVVKREYRKQKHLSLTRNRNKFYLYLSSSVHKGKLHGPMIQYAEILDKGHLSVIPTDTINFSQGTLNGRFYNYFKKNEKINHSTFGHYKNGKKQGLWVVNYNNNTARSEEVFENDSLIRWGYTESNKVIVEGRGSYTCPLDSVWFFDRQGVQVLTFLYKSCSLVEWRKYEPNTGSLIEKTIGDFAIKGTENELFSTIHFPLPLKGMSYYYENGKVTSTKKYP